MELRLLQLERRSAREEEDDERDDDRRDAEEPDEPHVGEVEAERYLVLRAGQEDDRDPREERRDRGRAPGRVTRAVEQLVAPVIPADPTLERGPRVEEPEHDQREERAAEEWIRDERVTERMNLERRHQA